MNYLNFSPHPTVTTSQDSLLCTIVNTLRNNTNPNFITETPQRSSISSHKSFPCRLVDDCTSSLHLFFPIKHITKLKHNDASSKPSYVAPLPFERDFDDINSFNLPKTASCSFSNLPNDTYFSSSDSRGTPNIFHRQCYPMTSCLNSMNHELNTFLHVNHNSSSLPMYSCMETDPTSFENFNVSMIFPQAPKFIYEEDSENNLKSF